jgi:hypothetical protein
MEHGRKMILVPQETMLKLQGHSSSTLSKLDLQMSKVLKDKTKTDAEKWQDYYRILQPYLHVSEEQRKPLNIAIHQSPVEAPVLPIETPMPVQRQITTGKDDTQDLLMNTVPQKFRRQATNLYNVLKNSNNVTWNENGEVTIKGKEIKGSNIVDLVNDVVRTRKNTSAEGWQTLAGALKDMNVPQEFIGNTKMLSYIRENSPRKQAERKQKGHGKLKWDNFCFVK